MDRFLIAGLVIGGIYALSSAGVVITYVSTGVLNLAFGSIAYFIARLYYYLHVQQQWGIPVAAVVSILVAAPTLGVLLYLLLFRFLRGASTLIKLVATIGLSVALPPIAVMAFGNVTILSAPGLAPVPVRVFHVLGVAVTLDQVITYICVAVVLLAGIAVLRFTEIGLKVRAMVDSEAMASLSGTNPSAVALGVWAVSVFLAGLAGVLAAPIISLDSTQFQILVASAFAAVVAARLRSLGVAVAVAFAMGIAGSLAQWALPPSSSIVQDLIPSIPFAFVVIFLVYYVLRRGGIEDSGAVGGVLDRAIESGTAQHGLESTAGLPVASTADRGGLRRAFLDAGNIPAVLALTVMALLPLVLTSFWGALVGEVMAVAVFMLSFTLVTGQGGMIWLCQITFAGVGALATAQLATNHGWPLLAAIVAGGVIAAAMGAVIALLAVRLGDLYVALATMTFALLMSTLVFQFQIFSQYGAGVSITRPGFAAGNLGFAYFAFVIFIVLGSAVYLIRRSTSGLVLSAIRSSVPGARSVGIGAVRVKIFVSTAAAFVAGVGGGLMATYAGAALADSYDVFTGLVFLAVLVTVGVRTNTAALVAATSYVFLPALFLSYLPNSLDQVPTALFGLGAILVARNPDGVLAMHRRQVRRFIKRGGGGLTLAGDGPVPGASLGQPGPDIAAVAGRHP
jgi:branched-chain amino acid transport system permease protein